MIRFIEKKGSTRIPKQDYVLEKEETLMPLLNSLTPKFEGTWSVTLVEPTIKFVNDFVSKNLELSFVDLSIYLGATKLETVLLKHPKLIPEKQSPFEAFMTVISELKNDIAHDASKYLYKACGGSIENAVEILQDLDAKCETGCISLDDVKQVCSLIKKPLYASQVYADFMLKSWDRWRKLNTLIHDLGESFAYYALKKQSAIWLADKCKYLRNEDVKNRDIANVDAPFICYAFTVFSNSRRPEELMSVMKDIDNRCQSTLERRLYDNL